MKNSLKNNKQRQHLTKENMQELNFHISKVSSMRYLKCFYALDCFHLSSPTTVGLLKIRKGKRSGPKQRKTNKHITGENTNNFKLTKKKLSIHYFIINEASHANYSECIMNFMHHMSNELACLTQQEGQGNLC